jgi:hypothetical protein
VTATLLMPGWFVALVIWNFMVLAAAQLTIRLIMAFSVRTTLLGTVVLTIAAVVVAVVYDLVSGGPNTLSARLAMVPITMVLMALVGFATARYALRIKRQRGQIIAGVMVGLLDFHVFTLLSP